MRKNSKCALIALLAGILLFSSVGCSGRADKTSGFFGNLFFSKTHLDDVEKYEQLVASTGNAKNFMPALEDLSSFTSIQFRYCEKLMLIFESQSLSLFVSYDNDDYYTIKNQVLEKDIFLTEPIINGELYMLPVTETEYREHFFKVIPDEEFKEYAVKSFAMFGYNDDNKSLVFLYFYDFDLDLMGTTDKDPQTLIKEFMDEYFDWI